MGTPVKNSVLPFFAFEKNQDLLSVQTEQQGS